MDTVDYSEKKPVPAAGLAVGTGAVVGSIAHHIK